ncbi:hypothetical protein KUF71_013322 [Frankliniella fusca]|uniref:Uncharacterized protein n=1 Tax=Frankliniella fusca TaxID=407009 RepID=A0AAE1GUP0_9NEOP|nr:hypothetical protein KUF71_019356 [Frankliniella fusca]KAK3909302.1 hypothetical protein KUF71_019357 [Frankliniella fusca]KAK3925048.1 hypothetical protein KUF71_013322 [Frankliniella fusca]
MIEPSPDLPLHRPTEAAVMLLTESREMFDRTALVDEANGLHSYTPHKDTVQRLTQLNGNEAEAITLLTEAKWVINDAAERAI